MRPIIKLIRGLFGLASVRSSAVTAPTMDDAIRKILSRQYADAWSDVALSSIVKFEDGPALLHALKNEYLVQKAIHCKKRAKRFLKNVAEHEFVIVHLCYEGTEYMFRIDRSIGPKSSRGERRKSSGSNSSSSQPDSSSPHSTPSPSSSMESIFMHPAQIVDYCVCLLSNISSSSRHWARDTINQIYEVPEDTYQMTIIDFAHASSPMPSLWDLVHLVQFVNDQRDEYSIVDAQCYWYADMVSGILESWCPDATIVRHHGWKGTKQKELSIPAPGTCKGVSIHKRDPELLSQKKAMLIKAIEESNDAAVSNSCINIVGVK